MSQARRPRALAELLPGVERHRVWGDEAVQVTSVAFDSRECVPGALFVALRGGYTDGHHYLDDARRRGAIVAVVDDKASDTDIAEFPAAVVVPDTRAALASIAAHYYEHPSRDLTLIGVTGTDGKTTTSHMIEAICRSTGRRTGLIGTVEMRIGDEVNRHESRQTTPESLLVQRYLADMRDAGIDVAVLEATSHGLVMHRLDCCAFDIGVVTNITHEHLDFHGTVENYRLAKGQLFRKVDASRALGKRGVVVVNLDDPGARSIESLAGGSIRLGYSSTDPGAAVISARDIATVGRTSFTLSTPAGSARVQLNLPGRYNVANALAAAGAGLALDLSPAEIARGLESLASVPGRMEVVDEGQPFQVIVDYAHTPEALRQVLGEARRFGSGRLRVLFGSAGERDIAKRAIQGAVAVELADYAIFTSEDPRFEDPDAIIEAIAAGAVGAGGRRGVHFDCIEDRRQAISQLIASARPGDVLVLAGKGHEHSMIYGDERRPWSDTETARELLREAGYGAARAGAGATG